MQWLTGRLNKAPYVGLTALQYAKLLMLGFHNKRALPRLSEGRLQLILTGAHCLFYQPQMGDVFAGIDGAPQLAEYYFAALRAEMHSVWRLHQEKGNFEETKRNGGIQRAAVV